MSKTAQTQTPEEIMEDIRVPSSTVSRMVSLENISFHPNTAVRHEMHANSHILGVVAPQTVDRIFAEPHFPTLFQDMVEAAQRMDYNLALLVPSQHAPRKSFYRQVLHSRMLDGVILFSAPPDDPLIPHLLKDRIPFVVVGRTPHHPEASSVDVDHLGSVRMAAAHLLQQARHRIGLIVGPSGSITNNEWLDGYRLALHEAGLAFEPMLVAEGDFTEVGGYMAMQRLLAANTDAVFACSDSMALGASRALLQANRRVPEDVALIGLGDDRAAAHVDPPFPTIRLPIRALGTTTADLLLKLITGAVQGPVRMVLPVEPIHRGSQRAPGCNLSTVSPNASPC